MKNETVADLRLFYDAEQQEATLIIGMACERSVELLHQRWGLATPEDCRVYVMTSWLHEGLATLAMEHYLDRRIVRVETLENLLRLSPTHNGGGMEKLRVDDPQALISQYVRGYWLTRYIEETRPELLPEFRLAPEGQQAIKKIGAFIRKYLN